MNAIVVVDENWAIGREGTLLFSLPTDMKHFRTLTMGGTVIMGRKTLESFPGGRPLPKRRNIVITRSCALELEGAETAPNPQAAVDLASEEAPDRLWVIGGGSVYNALVPRCRRVYLTKVDAAAEEPDTFFPNLDKLQNWKIEEISAPVSENGVTYRFINYVNLNI